METIESIDLISRSSGIRCGKPCISGTSLRVTDVASDYELSLAQVHAALAYYYGHKAELHTDIRQHILTARNAKESPPYGEASVLS